MTQYYPTEVTSHKNKPGFNRDKSCQLISSYWDLTKYNRVRKPLFSERKTSINRVKNTRELIKK